MAKHLGSIDELYYGIADGTEGKAICRLVCGLV